MAFLTAAAQGASVANSIAATNYAASSARAIGQTQAGAERYSAAVNANQVLISSENSARAAETNAANEQFNATVADQLAQNAVQEAGANATDYRKQLFARLASARNVQGASGLVLEGSPLMVDQNTFSKIEFGAQRLVYAGTVKANTLRNESSLLRQQSALDTQTAKLARVAGKQSVTNILGAGDLAATAAQQSGEAKAGAAIYSGTANTLNSFANLGSTLFKSATLSTGVSGASGRASWF